MRCDAILIMGRLDFSRKFSYWSRENISGQGNNTTHTRRRMMMDGARLGGLYNLHALLDLFRQGHPDLLTGEDGFGGQGVLRYYLFLIFFRVHNQPESINELKIY